MVALGYHQSVVSEKAPDDARPTHFIKIVDGKLSIIPIQSLVDDFRAFMEAQNGT